VKKLYSAVICLVAAVSLMCWSIGVAMDVFRSSVFSSFWWLSYQSAHYGEFVALSLGGAVLMFGINYFATRDKKP
jgi:hypothetical protein